MTYYPDLSPYVYLWPEPDTVNVGWLAQGHPFPTGATTPELRARLALFCAPEHLVNQTRGFHVCQWCSAIQQTEQRIIGSAEIRVVGPRRVYAAPELICHYVVAHDYLPPAEFITAVLEGPPPGSPAWRARIAATLPERDKGPEAND